MRIPPIRSDQITPPDAKLSLADAKKVFRQWMLQTGFLDRIELPDHIRYFSDEVKAEEIYLKSEVTRMKEEVDSELYQATTEIKRIRRELTDTTDLEKKGNLQQELEDALSDREEQLEYIEERQSACLAFKADKRSFLIEYINRQTQGAA